MFLTSCLLSNLVHRLIQAQAQRLLIPADLLTLRFLHMQAQPQPQLAVSLQRSHPRSRSLNPAHQPRQRRSRRRISLQRSHPTSRRLNPAHQPKRRTRRRRRDLLYLFVHGVLRRISKRALYSVTKKSVRLPAPLLTMVPRLIRARHVE